MCRYVHVYNIVLAQGERQAQGSILGMVDIALFQCTIITPQTTCNCSAPALSVLVYRARPYSEHKVYGLAQYFGVLNTTADQSVFVFVCLNIYIPVLVLPV